jgi:hypothetical protein
MASAGLRKEAGALGIRISEQPVAQRTSVGRVIHLWIDGQSLFHTLGWQGEMVQS